MLEKNTHYCNERGLCFDDRCPICSGMKAEEQWEQLYNKASAERDRLREVNAELLAALKKARPVFAGTGLANDLNAAIARAEQT